MENINNAINRAFPKPMSKERVAEVAKGAQLLRQRAGLLKDRGQIKLYGKAGDCAEGDAERIQEINKEVATIEAQLKGLDIDIPQEVPDDAGAMPKQPD